jgi:hypothetical protein
MRKIITAFGILLMLTGSVWSAQSEIDTDLMQTIEDLNKSLSSNLAIKDTKAATADTRELEELFVKVEAFYAAQGDAADAVTLSTKSKDLAQGIAKSITMKDFDAATNAATTLSRTCKTCHNFYKKS